MDLLSKARETLRQIVLLASGRTAIEDRLNRIQLLAHEQHTAIRIFQTRLTRPDNDNEGVEPMTPKQVDWVLRLLDLFETSLRRPGDPAEHVDRMLDLIEHTRQDLATKLKG